jgi:hypothetical protein
VKERTRGAKARFDVAYEEGMSALERGRTCTIGTPLKKGLSR